jgi:hypothetical protein
MYVWYLHYHGILEYQFYTTMKCVKEDRIQLQVAPIQALQYNNQKTMEYNVFLSLLVA